MDVSAYVDALLTDLEVELQSAGDREIGTVFIGGGTPSLMSSESITRLLEGVRLRAPLADEAEITLEANPGAVDSSNFAAYRAAGINRLSLGAQSFQPDKLQSLGRIHTYQDIGQAFEKAVEAGFGNINIDLMFALPGQSLEDAVQDISMAMALGPTHLSWYQLTIEPNTAFDAAPPKEMPDDESAWEIFKSGHTSLKCNDYKQYEISAYAKPGYECRHNLNYWRFGDYLGIGAGAHGKITMAQGLVERRKKLRHPQAYMAAAGEAQKVTESVLLQNEDLVLEFMMNALRLNTGVPLTLFAERTGLSPAAIEPQLSTARSRGLMDERMDWIRSTALGRRYLNELLLLFV